MRTRLHRFIVLSLLVVTTGVAQGQNPQELIPSDAKSVSSITPIFGELVRHSYPQGFTPIFEKSNATTYIQEHVLAGESLTKWTQMLSVTGIKGLASNTNATPLRIAQTMLNGFKSTCPTSFTGVSFDDKKIEGRDAFTGYLSCGTIKPTGEPHKTAADTYSESMILIVIKGEQSYYTLQWAERSAPSETPIPFEPKKWSPRIKGLFPLRVCPKIPNEQAPYPSC